MGEGGARGHVTHGGSRGRGLTGVRGLCLVPRRGWAIRIAWEVKVLGDAWGYGGRGHAVGGHDGLEFLNESYLRVLWCGGRPHQSDGRAHRGA